LKSLLRFFQRFLRHKRPLLAGFLCIPLAQLADIGITVTIGSALDRLQKGDDGEFLAGIFAIILGLSVCKGVFRYLQRWWIVAVSRHVEIELKQELFDKLVSLPLSFHVKSRSGDVVSRVTSDVENIRMFLGPGVMYTLGAVVMVPASIALLFTHDATLALTMLIPLGLMALGMKVFTPRLHKWSEAVQISIAELSSRAQENFSGIRVVKGYGREASQAARFASASAHNRENQIELGRARGLTHALTHAANDFTFVVILVIGGWAMIDRELPAGELFQFIDLTFKVFWPLIALGWIAGMYPRAVASARRIEELLQETNPVQDPALARPSASVRGEWQLRNLSYTYPGASRPAFQGLSVEIGAGGTLGIVGPTGSGKTTLLLCLCRMLEPAGDCRLDGTRIQDWKLADLRGALGYVPQDSFLFSDTWRANVEFGSDTPLSEPRVRELARLSAMEAELEGFPAGIDTRIGERGVTLSGGQRQRTAIARALARDPRVLVLDDALSAVDTETEAQLLRTLQGEVAGRTLIIAAHRLSSVQRADTIVVLSRDGRVEAQGTHAQLIARAGWYRDTWQRQQAQRELASL
jgi:ATP-binding cassette subfamily B multidrug efflux pump